MMTSDSRGATLPSLSSTCPSPDGASHVRQRKARRAGGSWRLAPNQSRRGEPLALRSCWSLSGSVPSPCYLVTLAVLSQASLSKPPYQAGRAGRWFDRPVQPLRGTFLPSSGNTRTRRRWRSHAHGRSTGFGKAGLNVVDDDALAVDSHAFGEPM